MIQVGSEFWYPNDVGELRRFRTVVPLSEIDSWVCEPATDELSAGPEDLLLADSELVQYLDRD